MEEEIFVTVSISSISKLQVEEPGGGEGLLCMSIITSADLDASMVIFFLLP
jgi:hypothetical protein